MHLINKKLKRNRERNIKVVFMKGLKKNILYEVINFD